MVRMCSSSVPLHLRNPCGDMMSHADCPRDAASQQMRLDERMLHADVVKQAARALGFSHVGIAEAGTLEPERARLEEWLARGYHAGMQWMARDPERRTDPALVLPGARSVIAVARNYYHPTAHSEDSAHAKISRYAWGDDYHDRMTPLVEELARRVEQIVPGALTRVYVDTGPSLDKAWAVRAGIGWLGRHTNVITRDRGSWVFLGVIFTTAVLAPDAPIPDFCGTCTACIDACPTHAITEPYVVDANRCIPYLTIELKDEEIRGVDAADLGSWVFGCDICQDVCPWNRFARPTDEECYAPRAHAVAPPLADLAVIDDDSFRARFRGSPVMRAKPRGMRRNARTLLAVCASHETSSHESDLDTD